MRDFPMLGGVMGKTIAQSGSEPTNPIFIAVPGDFPTVAEADENLSQRYVATANVTDSNPAKTFTGQSFTQGEEFLWDGAAYIVTDVQFWQDTGILEPLVSGKDIGTSTNTLNTVAAALVNKDGSVPLTADWNAGSFKITTSSLNVGNIDHSGSALILKNASTGITALHLDGNGPNYAYARLSAGSDPNANTEYRQDNGSISRINFGTSVDTYLINGSARPVNVRIAGDTDTNLFYCQGSTDRIGIGKIPANNKFEVNGSISIDSGNTYKINNSAVVNQDVTSGSSPAFGSPTATTQSPGDNTTKVATTEFVQAAVGGEDIWDRDTTGSPFIKPKVATDPVGADATRITKIWSTEEQIGDLILGGSGTLNRITVSGTQAIQLIPTNGSVTVGTGSLVNSINFDNSASGKFIGVDDGTDVFGIYNRAGSPESAIAADIGSICTDTSNGIVYVKKTDTANTGWKDLAFNGEIPVSTANVSNPPTDAELDAAFGTPATVGAGFVRILNDNAADTNVYFVASTGSSWFYTTLGKAT